MRHTQAALPRLHRAFCGQDSGGAAATRCMRRFVWPDMRASGIAIILGWLARPRQCLWICCGFWCRCSVGVWFSSSNQCVSAEHRAGGAVLGYPLRPGAAHRLRAAAVSRWGCALRRSPAPHGACEYLASTLGVPRSSPCEHPRMYDHKVSAGPRSALRAPEHPLTLLKPLDPWREPRRALCFALLHGM